MGGRFSSDERVYKHFWNRQYFYVKNILGVRTAFFFPLFMIREITFCLHVLMGRGHVQPALFAIIRGLSDTLKMQDLHDLGKLCFPI